MLDNYKGEELQNFNKIKTDSHLHGISDLALRVMYNRGLKTVEDMEKHLSFRYQEIVADAGYESEENYLFLEKNGQSSFIKPMNYEISKTRKYKKDIGKMENMEYDPEKDSYRCQNRKMLTVQYQRKQKTATGYLRTVTVYQCHECKGCPFKEKCIKGNNCKTPMEKREKRLYVSKVMKQKREENVKRIISEYGNQLDEPKYTGRRLICERKRRYEFSKISL